MCPNNGSSILYTVQLPGILVKKDQVVEREVFAGKKDKFDSFTGGMVGMNRLCY
jgi:hypothetical protein